MAKTIQTKLIRFLSSWKVAACVLLIYICVLGFDWISENCIGQTTPGLIFYTAKPKIDSIQLNSNQLKVPFPMYVDALDYWNQTDRLLAAYIQTGKHMLLISSPKDCADSISRYLVSRLLIDSMKTLIKLDPKSNCMFMLKINGDSTLGYHIRNYWGQDDQIESFYIPSRCLYVEIQGTDITVAESMEYIRKIVYWMDKKFEWHLINPDSAAS